MSDWSPVGSHPPVVYHVDPAMVAAHYCAKLSYEAAVKSGQKPDYDSLLAKRLSRIRDQAKASTFPWRKPKRGGDTIWPMVAVVGLIALAFVLVSK